MHMTLPLLPIIIERWATGTVTPLSLILTASMYAISLGLSALDELVFAMSLAVCILFAACYGGIVSSGTIWTNAEQLALASILFVFFAHGFERHRRHVIFHEEYRPFGIVR